MNIKFIFYFFYFSKKNLYIHMCKEKVVIFIVSTFNPLVLLKVLIVFKFCKTV